MNAVSSRDLILSASACFVLWVLSWFALVAPTSHRITWERMLGMPLGVAFTGMGLLAVGCVITCAVYVILYRLVAWLRLSSRTRGELLFVLIPGFCMVVLLASSNPWLSLLIAWVFFSAPALYTVLWLRGMEWHRRRKLGHGEPPANPASGK